MLGYRVCDDLNGTGVNYICNGFEILIAPDITNVGIVDAIGEQFKMGNRDKQYMAIGLNVLQGKGDRSEIISNLSEIMNDPQSICEIGKNYIKSHYSPIMKGVLAHDKYKLILEYDEDVPFSIIKLLFPSCKIAIMIKRNGKYDVITSEDTTLSEDALGAIEENIDAYNLFFGMSEADIIDESEKRDLEQLLTLTKKMGDEMLGSLKEAFLERFKELFGMQDRITKANIIEYMLKFSKNLVLDIGLDFVIPPRKERVYAPKNNEERAFDEEHSL